MYIYIYIYMYICLDESNGRDIILATIHTHTHTTQSTQPDGSRAEFQVTAGANLRDSLIDNAVQVSFASIVGLFCLYSRFLLPLQ